MTEQEPMSIVDAAWLRMDRPTNLMMICGMMTFAEKVDVRKLKEVIRTRMLCFHRFRQRVVGKAGSPLWEIDPDFDLNWHVRRMALPDGGREGALEAVTSDLISTPLDPGKPMWQFHLIDDAHGGSVVVLRIHHCYGDGFALTHVVATMTDIDPDKPHAAGEDMAARTPKRSAWERIFGSVTEMAGDAIRSSLSVADAGRNLLLHPAHAVDYVKTGSDFVYEAAVIANMTPDSPTRFKGSLGVMKRVAWAPALPLPQVKALSAVLECSVNDVLVACVAGAMRNYLLEQGDPMDETEIRALVPVNLRPPGPITELGNHFGLVFLSLPVEIGDPVERVFEVRKRMGKLKHSQQPLVALCILAGMGLAPEPIKENVLEALAANASAVITNVRGSEQPCYFAGKRITRQIFWVPQSGGIGIGISILSYAGEVSFGVVTDTRRVPNPDVIARRFAAEFETLLMSSLMMSWPDDPGSIRR